ncbi:MAG: FlgO family outer membrane protein [Arcobacteraceae bacterium]
MFKIVSLFIITFFISGCSLINSSEDSFKFKYYQSTGTTDFHLLTQELLKDLAPTILSIKAKKRNISPLYVTDFVNVENLDNKSKLGFILSDELKTNITQDVNWPIYQIEYAKFLKVGPNGTKLLSRNISDLKYKNMDDNTYALVGTYAITQRQLLIYLKLINLKNGVILKSSTQRVSLTDEIINLEQKETEIQRHVYTPLTI